MRGVLPGPKATVPELPGGIIPLMLIMPIRSGFWRLVSVQQPVGALVGPLILASGLSAQTLPVPTLPPEPPSETGLTPQTGTEAAVPETPTPRPWEYGLGIGLGYDSNIDFRVPDGPSSWAISPRGNLARVFRSPKGQLRLGGTGNWIGYPEQKEPQPLQRRRQPRRQLPFVSRTRRGGPALPTSSATATRPES